MDTTHGFLAGIDYGLLTAIWNRVVNVQTIQDAQAFAQKVHEAADILIAAGLRLAGADSGTRALLNDDQAAQVERICTAYQKAREN